MTLYSRIVRILSNLNLRIRICFLKREFASINDEFEMSRFLLLVRSGKYHRGKMDIDSEIEEFRRQTGIRRRRVAMKIAELRSMIIN